MTESRHFEKLKGRLPLYYLDFLEHYPLADCDEGIREELPCDLEQLKQINEFHRDDITDKGWEELGTLFIVTDAAGDEGGTLAIDLAKPESQALYALDFEDKSGRDLPFNPIGKDFRDVVRELLEKDTQLRRARAEGRLPWIFDERSFRRYVKRVDYFLKVMPWLFLSAIPLLIINSAMGNHEKYGGLICVFTVFPAIGGWLGVTGLGVAWRLLIDLRAAIGKQKAMRPGTVLSALVFVLWAGVFLWGAWLFARVIVREIVKALG